MTPTELNDYWHKWHRFQQRYEKIFIPRIKEALREQVKQYIAARDINAVQSAPIYKVLVNLYQTTGTQWAAKIAATLPRKKARMAMGFTERIVELMRQYYGIELLNDAEGITATTKEYIQDVLSDAAEKGLSFDQIVKELNSPELTARRARVIARTETVAAANGAGRIYAEETGLPMNKTWIAVRDKRTRHSHSAEDNTTVDIKIDFTLTSGVTMSQPGARTQGNGLAVPANEVVNCRCTAAYTVKD